MRLAPAIFVSGWIAISALQAAAPRTAAPAVVSKAVVSKSELIDLNHASLEELETLPGIAAPWAEKIVRNRPYANKTQLLSKGVLSAAAYRKIRTLVIAKQ